MDILLSKVFSEIKNMGEYKIHFAKESDTRPLDAFMRSMEEWARWNMYSRNGKNDYNKTYIFSLIEFYPENNTWLFGGIWEKISYDKSKGDYPYEIKLSNQYKEYIGRLKISYEMKSRTVRRIMEDHFPKMVVTEVLKEPHSCVEFPGYKNIDVSYKTLDVIYKSDNLAWKNALSLKGIYLICDTKTGKKYVGKADGVNGLWGRWKNYIDNGHGGDIDLEKLVAEKGFDYVKNNYKFTILEIITNWDEEYIDQRESYWKRVLMSRLEISGHNKN